MQHLNLLDSKLLPSRVVLTAGLMSGLVGVALLGVMSHAFLARDALGAALRASLKSAPEAVVEGVPPEHLALQARLVQTAALVEAMQKQEELPTAPGEALERLLNALPEQAWLTEVELGPRGELKLTGGTLDVSVLPAFTQVAARAVGLQGRAVEVLRLSPRPATTEAPNEKASAGSEALAVQPVAAHLFSLASVGAERSTP